MQHGVGFRQALGELNSLIAPIEAADKASGEAVRHSRWRSKWQRAVAAKSHDSLSVVEKMSSLATQVNQISKHRMGVVPSAEEGAAQKTLIPSLADRWERYWAENVQKYVS